MPHPSDPGIPTLTQRAEPTLSPTASLPDTPVLTEVANGGGQAYPDESFPLLTEVAESAEFNDFPLLTDAADPDDFPLLTEAADLPPVTVPAPAAVTKATASATPPASILAARLQAEVEQAMRQALADAIEQLQARMDEELPRIVARVLQDVRPG